MNKVISYKVTAIYDCEECRGDGYVSDPHCTACGFRIPYGAGWWARNDTTIPCGHAVKTYLTEEYQCTTCKGKGTVHQEIELIDALRDLGFSIPG